MMSESEECVVSFEGFGEVRVRVGLSIMGAAQLGRAPQGSACGGVCACSTCHVYVKEGAHLLSELEDEENDVLDKAFDVRANSRLGCQAKLARPGRVVVALSRESVDAYYNEHPGERGH